MPICSVFRNGASAQYLCDKTCCILLHDDSLCLDARNEICMFADRIGVFVDFFPGIVDIILNLQIYRIMLQDAA